VPTLAQISDLHFGRTDPRVVDALRQKLLELQPDLLIVSGDLTQRARACQFRAARAFLDSLPFARLMIPGNHDVPLYAFWERWTRPYRKYRNWIQHELEPEYQDPKLHILGVNTVAPWKASSGALPTWRSNRIRARFHSQDRSRIRILVSHHPLSPVQRGLGDLGIDLILYGHVHHSGIKLQEDPSCLLIAAGTSCSTRRGQEGNAFNWIQLDTDSEQPKIQWTPYRWKDSGEGFQVGAGASYVRESVGANRAKWVQG